MPGARYCCLKGLRRAEFHACGIRRQAECNVTRYCQIACAGFCGIGMTGGGDLHRRKRRQVSRRGVDARRCDRSQRRVATRHAVDAPIDGSVRCVRYGRGEGHLAAKHQRSVRRFYGHFDRWRRRRWRRASCTAAERPRSFRQECDNPDSPGLVSFFVARREGPHANAKAGKGPAKRRGNGG